MSGRAGRCFVFLIHRNIMSAGARGSHFNEHGGADAGDVEDGGHHRVGVALVRGV